MLLVFISIIVVKDLESSRIIYTPTVEITYLDLHVIIEEDVAQLQVSVDDSVVVQVLDTLEQLCHVVASLWLSHGLTPLVQLQQGLKENGWISRQ